MWDYVLAERQLDRMMALATELGDALVNDSRDLPGANSPYQILFHCCGMLEWWTRSAILGFDVVRDRDGEFASSGTVESLGARVDIVREQLLSDLHEIDPAAPLRGDPSEHYRDTPI